MKSSSGALKVWLMVFVCGGLGYGVYKQSGRQIEYPPPLSKPAKQKAAPNVGDSQKLISLPDIADLNQLVDRPLFSQSRRPEILEPEPKAPPPEKKKSPLAIELTGVMIVGKSRIALLKQVRGKKSWQGEIGQTIEGWEIRNIEPNQIVLIQSGETRILKLVDRTPVKPRRPASRRRREIRKTPPLTPPNRPTFNRRLAPGK